MQIINNDGTVMNWEWEWLEDSPSGNFSRMSTTPEESVWVCNVCGYIDVDPYEVGCEGCDTVPDMQVT